ncbi:acylneuraminate cytidylyltransferase family protein [Leptospira biflexa]|uniref:acylneuraminate cytidylyltransferase family protein n=1 Tax=Leptospira biflexa TaxID=172 RepID=UPI00109146A7|nr:acylneuraminate cytidylyltransferase family protein [Leptospira biflexa]TGM44531.1 acylneuraminate cytidylyltransferase family protein [Leptospira biflexa]TGM45428.1 acylneuraminate cytidylyltransferase family protein [Leptospira biflexa]
MKNTIAIIPARSGSKSIKDKNLAMINGHPLIAYSIAAGVLAETVSRTIVSTDSEEYADIAMRYGADVPFLRPPEISTDTSTDRDFMLHAMKWVKDNEASLPEFWVHLRPTTPLRNPKLIDEALIILSADSNATALRSAHPCSESPFKWFRKNQSGYLTALTSEETSLDRFNLPRQSYPDVYIPDGYVDVVRSSFVLNTEMFHGNKVIGYISPVCTEVDSPEELDLLEFQIKKYGSPLLNYLNKMEKK